MHLSDIPSSINFKKLLFSVGEIGNDSSFDLTLKYKLSKIFLKHRF